jgi:hypothetical protein
MQPLWTPLVAPPPREAKRMCEVPLPILGQDPPTAATTPIKLCACGCGKETKRSHSTNPRLGYVYGQLREYLRGHRPHGQISDLVITRFWSKANKTDSCWLWIPGPSCDGYGRFNYGRTFELSHRFAWKVTYGPIPEGLCVCHSCDTLYEYGDRTYKLCVRPDHLFVGTHRENIMDASAKGRMHPGERSGSTKITSTDVIDIRKQHSTGITPRTLSSQYGISKGQIIQIVNRRYWKHIP